MKKKDHRPILILLFVYIQMNYILTLQH
jgi:addiction module HigA family antidote